MRLRAPMAASADRLHHAPHLLLRQPAAAWRRRLLLHIVVIGGGLVGWKGDAVDDDDVEMEPGGVEGGARIRLLVRRAHVLFVVGIGAASEAGWASPAPPPPQGKCERGAGAGVRAGGGATAGGGWRPAGGGPHSARRAARPGGAALGAALGAAGSAAVGAGSDSLPWHDAFDDGILDGREARPSAVSRACVNSVVRRRCSGGCPTRAESEDVGRPRTACRLRPRRLRLRLSLARAHDGEGLDALLAADRSVSSGARTAPRHVAGWRAPARLGALRERATRRGGYRLSLAAFFFFTLACLLCSATSFAG